MKSEQGAGCGGKRHRGVAGGGFQVLELVKLVSAIGITGALVAPPVMHGLDRLRLRWAAEQVAGVLRGARHFALERGCGVGVRFGSGVAGGLTYAAYADGTGNGVRQRDVETGADPALETPRPLALAAGVRIGFPAGRRVRDPAFPGRFLGAAARPLDFGGGELAVFDPLGGGAAPGAVFLTDGDGLAVVRVAGGTGSPAVALYDPRTESWR